MRNYPEDSYDEADLVKLNAQPWQIELLKLNPEYTGWGPYEDYMCNKNAGWSAPAFYDNWSSFDWSLDDLNELVNFYFEVSRPSKNCECCDSTGYNPATKRIADNFYNYSSETGKGWHDNITEDELDVLKEKGRIKKEATLSEVNGANAKGGLFGNYNHDAINRMYLVETRAKRFGVYGLCEECKGKGSVYTAPAASVNLVLWVLHPRKGCSRGVEIKNIEEKDLPAIFEYLKEGAARNAERFSKIQ